MKTIYTCWLTGWLVYLVFSNSTLAQTPSRPQLLVCGTPDLTPAQALSLTQQAKFAFRLRQATAAPLTGITYVPIRPHILRRSDGTGGFSLANLNQAIALANSHYLPSGIQFYFAGTTPDYIDDSNLSNLFPYPEGTTVDGKDAYNALNQYYVNAIDGGYNGYAHSPTGEIYSTRSFISVSFFGVDGLGNDLIPHELGHTFNLLHTFGLSNGGYPTNELVTRGAGANCEWAGDAICDTPADPFGSVGVSLINVNGCVQYDPNSTARDANGDAYSPSTTNIMSYYHGCTNDFTPGQYERIQGGLALHHQPQTVYTLDAPPTAVIAPSNLVGTLTGVNSLSVVLTWQDNANNEMGYFIERSTSPTEGFVAIGGVAPNITTFTDTKITDQLAYYYRIRPSNTTTGSLSSTTYINRCTTPFYPSSSPARISAFLSWNIRADQTSYTLRWRPVGAPQWNTITNILSTPYSLTGLTVTTAYEWQVQAICSPTLSSAFTDLQSFTTYSCPVPSFSRTNYVGAVSAELFWSFPFQDPSRATEIRYRPVGSSAWTTISNVNSTIYTLTGLTNATTYEWQVRAICIGNESSDYIPLLTFTTQCQTPTGLSNTPTATQALLVWNFTNTPDVGTTYEVQYRPVGNSVWNTKSAIGNLSYTLTGLVVNTLYEWRVRTICAANAQSDYSVTNQFTTTCDAPIAANLSTSLGTSTSIQLNWTVKNDPGTQYDIRYRPVGSSDWMMVSTNSITTLSSAYALTGLTNNTTYEWQLRTACSPNELSAFVSGPTFTTQCRTPNSMYSIDMITSSKLTWESVGIDVTYEVRYHTIGASDWIISSNITSNTLIITNLTSNTTYEWQLRTICHDGSVADFSSISTFHTFSCRGPGLVEIANITTRSAQLTWYINPITVETHYQGRYRVVGTTDWTVLNNLSSINGVGYFVLTGLNSSTTYEWQIRTLCSDTESSDFTSSVTFLTLTICPDMHTIRDGFWNDPTLWSCSRVPISSDAVQIKHQVIIPASYAAAAQAVGFDAGQTLLYQLSAQLVLGQ